MICKYCGVKIDPENDICPKCVKCGNKVEGGNGFWDIAGGPKTESKPEPTRVNEQKSFKSCIPLAICGLLCLLCIVITIAGAASSNDKIKSIQKNYDMQLSEQTKQFAGENENLQSQIDQLLDRLTEISSQPTRMEESLRILSSPMPEKCSVGFQSREGFYLFGFRVEGQVASFRWEKQQQNGDWKTISFDGNNINEELGLRLDESISDGTTRLAAIGLTPVSFGTYKCTAIGLNGTSQSATVDLINSSLKADDASEAPAYDDALTPSFPSEDGSADDLGDESSADAESNIG